MEHGELFMAVVQFAASFGGLVAAYKFLAARTDRIEKKLDAHIQAHAERRFR